MGPSNGSEEQVYDADGLGPYPEGAINQVDGALVIWAHDDLRRACGSSLCSVEACGGALEKAEMFGFIYSTYLSSKETYLQSPQARRFCHGMQ